MTCRARPREAQGHARTSASQPRSPLTLTPAPPPAAARPAVRSVGVVILMLAGEDSTTTTTAAGPLDQPRVVGGGGQAVVAGVQQGPLQRGAPEHLGRLHRPQSAPVERARHRPPVGAATSLIVSDTGAAAITASAPDTLQLGQRALEQLAPGPAGAPHRGRRRDRRPGPPARPRAPTPSGPRRRPPRSFPPAPRQAHRPGSATTIRSIPATERSASTLHSSIGLPPSVTSALGRSDPRRSPRPAATINATATCFRGASPTSRRRRPCRSCRSSRCRTPAAGPGGAPRPRPRPSRART